MDWDELTLAISDSILLIAGGAFASAYVLVSTSSGDFLAKTVLAILLAIILAGFAFILRLNTPQEKVELSDESINRIVDRIEADWLGSSDDRSSDSEDQ